MKSHKKILWTAVAAMTIISMQTVAFAANTPKFEANLKSTQEFFEERRTAPMFLFEEAQKEPQNTIKLSTKAFSVEIKGTDIGTLDKTLQRYDLNVIKKKEKIDDYHKLLGEKTPKNVLGIAEKNLVLPAQMTVTLLDSSFIPEATVNVYRKVDKDKFETIQENIVVPANANVSFVISQGGEYVVTTRKMGDSFPLYDFSRPERTDINKLLSYTKDDTTNRYLTEDIESLQDYLKNKPVDEYDETYFDDLWKLPTK